MSEFAIEIQGLEKSYKDVHVLKGIDLTVTKGTVLGLLGPNGAGKTTTVRILSTLLKPDAGVVKVNGHDVVHEADAVRASIGLTGQYAAVDEYLTARENLVMMGRLYHLSSENARLRAQQLLEEFDLVEAADRAAKTFSGGMKRRLDLALSLVATPPIIFLDEPTTGLDPRSRLAVWDIVAKLKQQGTTILLTTQYLEEADKLADQIAVIDHGLVIAKGTANELKSKVGSERLELVFPDATNYTKAVQSIQAQAVQANAEERTISMATGGTVGEVKRVLDQLEQAGVEIDSLSLHKPTLDDVFLNLTGKSAEDAPAPTSPTPNS